MEPRIPAASPLREVLDGYVDVTALAHGRYSTVYRATELATGRRVALKVLDVEGVTPRELEAFAREIAVLNSLSAHPHILTLYGSFRTPDGRPVLALELCREALADRLHGAGLASSREAVAVAVKLAGALETAHRGGVLHRDVRPANVLITEYGEPALTDFGVARLRTAPPASSELFDFPSEHVAPELLLGLEATEASDVYGLASTLYELLAGTPPLAAYAGERPAATILRILRDPARPVARDDIPVGLNDLLLWALAKEPEQRPPSMAWFAEELMRIESLGDWTHTPSLIREPATPVREPAPARLPRPPRREGSTRPSPRPKVGELYPLTVPAAAGAGGPAARTVVRAPWLTALPAAAALAAPLWLAAAIALPVAAPAGWVVAVCVAIVLAASAGLAGLARPTLSASASGLRHRWLLGRDRLDWAEITALQASYEPSRRPGGPHGLLVAQCVPDERLPLRATRRRAVELAALAGELERHRPPAP